VIDPKPPRRVRNPDLLRLLHLEHDCCEVSGSTGSLHAHHVVFRSHGGSDVRANLLMLTADLHERYHRGDTQARFLVGTHIRDHRRDILSYVASLRGEEQAEAWLTAHLS
jgi:5-methylcytosine-specific restriction endonuclease McrA